MAIDLVINRHKAIQNMSIDKMAEYFGVELGLCLGTSKTHKNCALCKTCTQCWKEFLQGSDN